MCATLFLRVVSGETNMRKILTYLCLGAILLMGANQISLAKCTKNCKVTKQEKITKGKVTGKTVGACALSLLIWPGIGQAINDAPKEKVVTHAVMGILVIPRLWSAYDACVDRKGGYWEGRI